MDNPVIIFGANAIGRAAKEIFESNEIVVYGFLDEQKELHGTEIDDIAVLGDPGDDGFLKLIGKKCEAFVAEDNNAARKTAVKMLNTKRKIMPTNALHKSATIAQTAHIGYGNFVNMGVRIGSNAKISNHCIINTNAVIDYGAQLGDFVQIGAGTIINSDVEIEDEVFIGSGVTVVSGITIGKGARVGAGSLVMADVEEGQTVFGNPAVPVDN